MGVMMGDEGLRLRDLWRLRQQQRHSASAILGARCPKLIGYDRKLFPYTLPSHPYSYLRQMLVVSNHPAKILPFPTLIWILPNRSPFLIIFFTTTTTTPTSHYGITPNPKMSITLEYISISPESLLSVLEKFKADLELLASKTSIIQVMGCLNFGFKERNGT